MANLATSTVDGANGYGKSVAALVAGAVTTLGVYIIEQSLGHPLPAEITNAAQVIITAVAVYVVPHTAVGSGS